jgi:tetratricopeptide (TPR) repeat protein
MDTLKRALLLIVFLSFQQCIWAQNFSYQAAHENVYEKAVQALQNGDSIMAFQYLQSAHFYNAKNDEINYHYFSLALSLLKKNADKEAKTWLSTPGHSIYNSRLHFYLGKFYVRTRQENQALEDFNKVSIQDLNNEEIGTLKYLQGYLHFKLGNWDKATPILTSLRQVKNSPYYTDANYYAGFIALEKKQYELALNCFKISSVNPAYARLTPFYISQLYYFMGNIEAALENCQKALTLKDQYYSVQLEQLMGHLLFEKKEYLKALPYLASFYKKQPNIDAQDLYQLSFCYYQSQQWDAAIEGFKKLANVEDSLGQNSMYLLATSYLKVGDKLGAKNAFYLCATKSANLSQKEISSFNYAKLCYELKEYSNAISSFDKFMEAYNTSVYFTEAKNLWVSSLALSNNYSQALDAYLTIENPSVDLVKIYPTILYGRATLYINDGQIEKAYTLLTQLKNTPFNAKLIPSTMFWLGELTYKMGRINESIDYLEKFVLDPIEEGEISLQHAKYTLAYCYLKNANYSVALNLFTQVANSTTNNPYLKDAFVRVADCQMMLKQLKPALITYQKVIDTKDNYLDYATLHKAIIMGGLGQASDKIKILLDFESKFPLSQYINDALMELADTYVSRENFQEAISPLQKILNNKKAVSYFPQAYYKLGIVYFNMNKNEVSLTTFHELFKNYPHSIESDNAIEFVRNIYVEDQTPELFVKFMNEFGKPISLNEQDSLTYKSSVIKYEQKKYAEAAIGFSKYLQQFPEGKYHLEATNFIAEIAYSQQNFDTAAIYFGILADLATNKYAERASLLAARLQYFNFKNYALAEKYFTILDKIATQQENKTEAIKGLLRCLYKAEKWELTANIANQILMDKQSVSDDIQLATMSLYHFSVLQKDTAMATQYLLKVIKNPSSLLTAEAHYLLANTYLAQNKLALAEKTSFEVIKKQAAYEYWVAKTYLLLGDIYVAQKDNFNAIATYKSIVDNSTIEEIKLEAGNKLKFLVDNNALK